MPITRPVNLQTPFAASGTKNTIPVPSQIGITPGAASFTDGFPPLTFTPIAAGGVPPAGADFNGILNELSSHTVFQNAGGRYRFDATLAAAIGGYPVGFVLQDDAGLNEYVNILAANTTNFNTTPASIGVSWIPYSGQTATQSGANKYALDTSATVNALTAAISPAPLALTDGMTVTIVPAITNTGAVTFSLNGLPTHPAVNYSGAFTGGELVAGKPYVFTYNLASTSWYVTSSDGGITQTAADARYAGAMPNFTASTTAALISASLGVGKVDFRNAVLATGTPIEYNVTTALTLAMTDIAGSLGATTAVATSLIYAIVYGAGAPQLAVANLSGGLQMDETNLITTTAIGAGSTAANVWYSTSAISTSSQYRIIGRVDATWTSGTGWSDPTLVQPIGAGEAMAGLSSLGYGQQWKSITNLVAGTKYYNGAKPKDINIQANLPTGGYMQFTVNGVAGIAYTSNANTATTALSATVTIPANAIYSYEGNTALNTSFEMS